MRPFLFIRLAVLGFVMIAPVQVMAQGMIVGGFGCRQTMPCDGNDSAFPSMDKLMADTATCVLRNFSVVPETPIFDEISGLDNNGCLTTNPAAFHTGKVTALPHCCIMQTPSGLCGMHCSVVSQ